MSEGGHRAGVVLIVPYNDCVDAHSHGDHVAGANAQPYLRVALALILVFAAIEAAAGWWSGSLALLGDAGHMVTDGFALGIAAVAAWVAAHPPSGRHSYGLGRAEVIGALVNGLLMLVLIIAIVVEAVRRLQAPTPVAGGVVMLVAAAGLAVNVAVAVLLGRGEQTLNVRGALLHVMSDVLGSVAALVAGAVIIFTGWTPIDPILSVFICLLILYSSLSLLRDALRVVMEGVPRHLDLEEVGQAMAGGDARIRSVHDLHIWNLSSGMIALSAHVVIDDLRFWEEILEGLRTLLRVRFGIEHVTLQPESNTYVLQPMSDRRR